MRARTLAALVTAVLPLALASSAPAQDAPPLTYSAHVAGIGWQRDVTSPATAGTTGQARQMEALRIAGGTLASDIDYRAHVAGIGWLGWVGPAFVAGTTGQARALEAVQIRLTGQAATDYRVACQAHVANLGWLATVYDGATCGTTGQARRMEAVRIWLVPKATPTPTPSPTPTVTSPSGGVSLGITADTGIDDAAGRAVLTSLGQSAPTQSVILGDLAYAPAREADYCRLVRDRVTSPVAVIPGTHEGVAAGDGAWSTYAACLPAAVTGDYLAGEWYIDRGPVRLITLSPGVDLPTGTRTYSRGTPERERVKGWIDDAKSRGLWVVVGMHHGCLTIGVHGCASDPSITDMLIGKGVDVVLAGHDHNYARSHQIAGTVAAPVVADRDGAFRAGGGTVMVTVGNGGHNPRTIGSLGSLWAAGSGTNSPGGIAYGWVRLDATTSSLTGRLVTAAGPSLTDSWTITR